MPDSKASLRTVGARVFYRDKLADDYFDYCEGVVTDFKPVEQARAVWGQQWSHDWGWILEIEPVEDVEEKRKKYRHLSSVQTPEQYTKWLKGKIVWLRKYDRRLTDQSARMATFQEGELAA